MADSSPFLFWEGSGLYTLPLSNAIYLVDESFSFTFLLERCVDAFAQALFTVVSLLRCGVNDE